MLAEGESKSGVTADTVRRWETGDRATAATFRKHLVKVFGLTAEELGLLSADELASRPADQPDLSTVGNTGPVAGLVAETVRQVLHVMHDESSRSGRRILLREMIDCTAAWPKHGATSALSRPNVMKTKSKRALDPQTVAKFASITAAQRGLYFTTDADTLLNAVLPQLRLGVDLISPPHGDTSNFRELAGLVAQTALLAARMAFFDLDEVDLAADCFTVANQAVATSGDHALSAAVRAHQAFVPGFAGETAEARAMLDAAHAHVRHAPSPRLRSWLHCVSAEITARTGDGKASLNHIRQAEQALATQGEDPDWLDFFDESRWAGFAGQAYLLAGMAPQSAAHLRRALGQLDEGHKQRCVLLLDLAAAQAPADAMEAAAAAEQALDLLAAVPYAAARTRLPQVVAALRDTPFEGELQDRIRTLPAAPGP